MVNHDNFQKNEILIVDTRSHEEFVSGHIDGAILIPFNEINSKITKHTSDKAKPIALYCHSGSRASVAMQILKTMGYTNVVNYGSLSRAKKILEDKLN